MCNGFLLLVSPWSLDEPSYHMLLDTNVNLNWLGLIRESCFGGVLGICSHNAWPSSKIRALLCDSWIICGIPLGWILTGKWGQGNEYDRTPLLSTFSWCELCGRRTLRKGRTDSDGDRLAVSGNHNCVQYRMRSRPWNYSELTSE
jgi:hypothetical protein